MSFTHGLCRGGKVSAEYNILHLIKTRCLNPKTRNYYRYGGRGIKICDRWLNGENGLSGVECFIADVGLRPSPSHSIDRINNDGDYEPSNCRWATPKQQSNNTRRNINIEIGGRIYTFAGACEAFGLSYNHLYKRVTRKGWTLEQVIKEKSDARV